MQLPGDPMAKVMLKFLLPWPVTAFAIAWSHVPAIACSCVTSVDPAEFLREADLVFEGKVVSIQETDGIQRVVTLRVTTPLKGKLGQTVTLDQGRQGMCAAQFTADQEVKVIAYGDASRGYSSDTCSNFFIQSDDRSFDIQALAWTNHERTLALMGSDKLPPSAAQARLLVRWLSEYRALEEGLDAADRLLALMPGDPEARLFKAEFLSELNRDSEALLIAQVVLAHDPEDAAAQRRRVFSLARLNRSGEIPKDWKDFVGLRARKVDFRHRRMHNAEFRDAQLSDADFSGAEMTGADLSHATFSFADFSGADLSGANLFDASFYYGSNLAGADLRGAVMANARLDGIILAGADARGAILTYGGVSGDLSGADMRNADLRGTYFASETNWSGANLQNADLRDAHIEDDTIAKANLTGALYNGKTAFPPGFDPAAAGAILVGE